MKLPPIKRGTLYQNGEGKPVKFKKIGTVFRVKEPPNTVDSSYREKGFNVSICRVCLDSKTLGTVWDSGLTQEFHSADEQPLKPVKTADYDLEINGQFYKLPSGWQK